MDQYTEAACLYILKNEDVYFDEFFHKTLKPYKDRLHKIQSRPWYKKIYHDITGKQ